MVGTDLGPLAGKGGIFGATRAGGLGGIEIPVKKQSKRAVVVYTLLVRKRECSLGDVVLT